jgi:hypothetical protein
MERPTRRDAAALALPSPPPSAALQVCPCPRKRGEGVKVVPRESYSIYSHRALRDSIAVLRLIQRGRPQAHLRRSH